MQLLGLIGGAFEMGEELCGVAISVRTHEDHLAVWHKTTSDDAAKQHVKWVPSLLWRVFYVCLSTRVLLTRAVSSFDSVVIMSCDCVGLCSSFTPTFVVVVCDIVSVIVCMCRCPLCREVFEKLIVMPGHTCEYKRHDAHTHSSHKTHGHSSSKYVRREEEEEAPAPAPGPRPHRLHWSLDDGPVGRPYKPFGKPAHSGSRARGEEE